MKILPLKMNLKNPFKEVVYSVYLRSKDLLIDESKPYSFIFISRVVIGDFGFVKSERGVISDVECIVVYSIVIPFHCMF